MANPSLPRSSFLRFKTRAKSFHPLQLSLCSLFDKMESETNCITSIIGNENFTFRNRSDDCPEVVLLDFEDQSLSVINSTSRWVTLLIASLIGCVGINLAGKIFIMWYVICQSIPRPMNAMILIDQVNTVQIKIFALKVPLWEYFKVGKMCYLNIWSTKFLKSSKMSSFSHFNKQSTFLLGITVRSCFDPWYSYN